MKGSTYFLLFCILSLRHIEASADLERYPYLVEEYREIADRGEFFITKEKVKIVLFIFYNTHEEPEESRILQWVAT